MRWYAFRRKAYGKLQMNRNKKRDALLIVLAVLPTVIFLIAFISFIASVPRTGEKWDALFYRNEAELNLVNETLMNPANEEQLWYVSEIHYSAGKTEVRLVDRENQRQLERCELAESKLLSAQEKEQLQSLMKQFNIPFGSVDYTYNAYKISEDGGIWASFVIGSDNLPAMGSHTDLIDTYKDGQWFLHAITRTQRFDNPPDFYFSLLDAQVENVTVVSEG